MAKRNKKSRQQNDNRSADRFDELVRGISSFDRINREAGLQEEDQAGGSPLSDRIGNETLAKLNMLFNSEPEPTSQPKEASSAQSPRKESEPERNNTAKALVSIVDARAAASRAASERALERYEWRKAHPDAPYEECSETKGAEAIELLRKQKITEKIEKIKAESLKSPQAENEREAFNEELEHLIGAQEIVVSALVNAEEMAEKANQDKQGVYAIGPEDYEWVRDLRQNAEAWRGKVSDMAEIFKEPYFARIDLEQGSGQVDSHYIGSQYMQGVCIDWRSEVGQAYYVPNQTDFVIDGMPRKLSLKRSIAISNGCLKSVTTAYDAISGLAADGLTDSFLIEVLKDKRRERKATDIIRTIQHNQNEIIRQSSSRSFAVQGCAGSGKTMIMLHRLSYLAYNDKSINWSRTKIITPNAGFRSFINDLSERLGLQSIEMLSVEEYYGRLISNYSNKVSYDTDVVSEKALSLPLMRQLYSKECFEEVVRRYHEYWSKTLSSFSEDAAKLLSARCGARFPDLDNHSESTWIILDGSIRTIEVEIARRREKLESLQDELAKRTKLFSDALSESRRTESLLETMKAEIQRELEGELGDICILLERGEASRSEISEQLLPMLSLRDNYAARIESARQSMDAEIDINDLSFLEEMLRELPDESWHIAEQARAAAIRLNELKSVLDKTPRYNFGKRNALEREISHAEEVLQAAISQAYEARSSEAANQVKELEASLLQAEGQIGDLKNRLSQIGLQEESFLKRQALVSKCLDAISNGDAFYDALSDEEFDVLAEYEPNLKQEADRRARISKRCEQLTKEIEDLADRIEEHDGDPDEDTELALKMRAAIDALGFNRLHTNVVTRYLQDAYRDHGQTYTKNNYRHKLYLKLLCCSLYFNYAKGSDQYLNIDEAQDLSVAEYDLLQRIVGENCVFNLYGDVNQAIYEYKGIGDWSDVFCVSEDDVHVLNENYRNTTQITDRCNEEFYAGMTPIGISGAAVRELDTNAAVSWITHEKENDPDARLAIIFRHGIAAIEKRLQELLPEEITSWYQTNAKTISILTAEMAKGLEFDGVVVIASHMTENERYVSYTRAMDNLVIVNDDYPGAYATDAALE